MVMTTNARLTPTELIEVLSDQGLEPKAYSGRGMYGKHCVSVTFNRGDDAGNYTLPPGWTTDQMGLGVVFYWPRAEWPEERSP
jgi:hypothetical protein